MSTEKRYRDAGTGEYVSDTYAKANPGTTVAETPEDRELVEGIVRDYGKAQQMLREVGLHWSGRPLVESVREAVDEIKRLRARE